MIERIKYDEIIDAVTLIREVFDEFILKDFSKDGVENFYKRINYQSILDRIQAGNRIYVFKTDERITGYIELSGLNHIYFLFVKKEFQKQGIAAQLIESVIIYNKDKNPGAKELTVNSTLNALGFYEKLGFNKIADYQMKNGIVSFPMSLVIAQKPVVKCISPAPSVRGKG